MADFRMESRRDESGVHVLTLAGDMDKDSFALLEDGFNKLLESGARGAVADLGGLEGITSAGLGAILNLGHSLARRGGRLAVAAPSGAVGELIGLVGIGEALGLLPTLEEALRAVKEAVPDAGREAEPESRPEPEPRPVEGGE